MDGFLCRVLRLMSRLLLRLKRAMPMEQVSCLRSCSDPEFLVRLGVC